MQQLHSDDELLWWFGINDAAYVPAGKVEQKCLLSKHMKDFWGKETVELRHLSVEDHL